MTVQTFYLYVFKKNAKFFILNLLKYLKKGDPIKSYWPSIVRALSVVHGLINYKDTKHSMSSLLVFI
jgi:hypothetical protein